MPTSQSRSFNPASWLDDGYPREVSVYLELIEASGSLVRAGAVAKRLGIATQMVERLRQAGQLLAVPLRDGYGYPSWQFEGRSLLSGLPTTLRALGDQNPWEHTIFFLTPNSLLAGQRPLDVLREGRQ